MIRILEKYKKEVVPKMMGKYHYKSEYQIPKIKKIVLNMGVGDGKQDLKVIEEAIQQLTLISGQKPIVTRAKKSIAGFNLRKGMQIGCKVTLRGKRMYDFFEKLINIAIPRIKDFRGIPLESFDSKGNYTLGIKEQIIFPEINYNQVQKIRGMNITIEINTNKVEEAKDLLIFLELPFKKK